MPKIVHTESLWKVIADNPPEPYQDCLLMYVDGTVSRDNLPQHGTEPAVWWQPFVPPPRQHEYEYGQVTASEALKPK